MSRIFVKPNTNSTSVTFTDATIWQGGVAPGSADEVHILDCKLKFDLTLDFSGIKLADLFLYDTFEGTFGGTGTNEIRISFDRCRTGLAAVPGRKGNQSPLINCNYGSNAAVIQVDQTKSLPGTDAGKPPVRFIGTDTNTSSLTVLAGFVGFGVNSISQTGAMPEFNVTGTTARVRMGPGITLATVRVGAGEAEVQTAVTTLELTGSGKIITSGNWQMGTATLSGGTAVFNHRNSGGTEVQNLLFKGGTMDLTQKPDAFAATATEAGAGTIKQFKSGQFAPGTLTLADGGNRSLSLSRAA